jgi:FixJ family two-component response regulator
MSGQGSVITVVEDDAGMAKAIARLLRAKGFRVEVFDSAEAFLASSSVNEARCLVVDIQLGGMSGLDLCRTLAANGSQAAFVFITALEDCELKKAAFEAGGVAYIRKPFLSDVLVAAIDKASV